MTRSCAVFLDCEFTSFESPQLLSMGLAGPGRTTLYLEYDLTSEHGLWLLARCNGFVGEQVLPQFGRQAKKVATPRELGTSLAYWLESLSARVQVAYDHHSDFDLLEQALKDGGQWNALCPRLEPVHVGYLWGAGDALAAAEQSWKQSSSEMGVERHHALADALALRAAYLTVHG